MDNQTTLFDIPQTNPSKNPVSLLRQEPLHIFIDGASRGNPGPAGAGIYISQAKKLVLAEGIFLGKKTNNQAEYLALLLAILFIKKLFKDKTVASAPLYFFSDSELLIKQMNGIYKVKNEQLQALKRIIVEHVRSHTATFKHVYRDQNVEADALANQGIDTKKKVPVPFAKALADYGLHF
ncbi:ribonuclease HI family protein [Candidatus Dependentiae bacterium]|nr:ribonuclease HI family protein [Candidatus Dependentiae bacterium]